MKKLLLLRHAKSDWDDFTLEDHERPLNERGQHNAQQMGAYMADNTIHPDIIYCSTAQRTRQTLSLLLAQGGLSCPVDYVPDIYEATASTLISIVTNCPDKYDTLLIVGHNPGIQMLGLTLTEGQNAPLRRKLEYRLPTGTLQNITLNINSYTEITQGCGTLESFTKPKSLSVDN